MMKYVDWSLAGLVCIAAIYDVRQGRIPNRLVAVGCVAAWACSLSKLTLSPLEAAAGMMVPVLFPGILFVMGMMGAGDIKLLCMIGAFLGAGRIVQVTALAFAVGAVQAMAVLVSCRRNGTGFAGFERLGAFLKRDPGNGVRYLELTQKESRMCFTPAVFAGLLLHLFLA